MDLVIMVVMEEAALVMLEKAEAVEVMDRVMETRAVAMVREVAMVGEAAITSITTEEVEAVLVVVVEAILDMVEVTVILAITTVSLHILEP